MRLVINPDGTAHSLIHKPSGEECLAQNTGESVFNVTQYRPYDNELQLAFPAKVTQFPSDSVRRETDRLVVVFRDVGYQIEKKSAFNIRPVMQKPRFPLWQDTRWSCSRMLRARIELL